MRVRNMGPTIGMFRYFSSDPHLFGIFVTLMHFEVFTTKVLQAHTVETKELFMKGCREAADCTLWDIEQDIHHFYTVSPKTFTKMIRYTNNTPRIKRILSYCK